MSFVRLPQVIRVLLTLFQPIFLSISLRTSETFIFMMFQVIWKRSICWKWVSCKNNFDIFKYQKLADQGNEVAGQNVLVSLV